MLSVGNLIQSTLSQATAPSATQSGCGRCDVIAYMFPSVSVGGIASCVVDAFVLARLKLLSYSRLFRL